MKTPEEKRSDWSKFVESLLWVKGELDVSTWQTFLRAASCQVPRNDAMDVVCKRIQQAGGVVRPGKLESQCLRAYSFVSSAPEKGVTWSPRPGWVKPVKPAFDDSKLRAFSADWSPHVNSVWLGNRSAVDPAQVNAGRFLELLYQPGEHVVLFSVFESQGQMYWTAGNRTDGTNGNWEVTGIASGLPWTGAPFWDVLSGPAGVWFLCQPVDGKVYPNPRETRDGKIKMSRRSMEAVTSWRYLVMESDEANARDWLGALVQLPLRIAAIYTSGGKSIHALVRVDAVSKAHWDAERDGLLPVLVTLGADPAALTAVRLTRLPGCLRGGVEQKLLYLNPRPSGLLPICALPPKRDVAADYTRFAESVTGDEVDLEFKSTVRAGLKHYAAENAAMAEKLKGLL